MGCTVNRVKFLYSDAENKIVCPIIEMKLKNSTLNISWVLVWVDVGKEVVKGRPVFNDLGVLLGGGRCSCAQGTFLPCQENLSLHGSDFSGWVSGPISKRIEQQMIFNDRSKNKATRTLLFTVLSCVSIVCILTRPSHRTMADTIWNRLRWQPYSQCKCTYN